jgi:hypothetical protein
VGVSRECAEHINSSCAVLVEVVLDVVALKQFLAELGDYLCGLYLALVGDDDSVLGPPQSRCPITCAGGTQWSATLYATR